MLHQEEIVPCNQCEILRDFAKGRRFTKEPFRGQCSSSAASRISSGPDNVYIYYIGPIIINQALRTMTPRPSQIHKIDKTPNSTNKSDK